MANEQGMSNRHHEIQQRLNRLRDLKEREEKLQQRERNVDMKIKMMEKIAAARNPNYAPLKVLANVNSIQKKLYEQLDLGILPSTYDTSNNYVPANQSLLLQLIDMVETLLRLSAKLSVRCVALSKLFQEQRYKVTKEDIEKIALLLSNTSTIDDHVLSTFFDENKKHSLIADILEGYDEEIVFSVSYSLADYETVEQYAREVDALRSAAIHYARAIQDMAEDLKCSTILKMTQ